MINLSFRIIAINSNLSLHRHEWLEKPKISHAINCMKFLIYELINNDRVSLSGRINPCLLPKRSWWARLIRNVSMTHLFIVNELRCNFLTQILFFTDYFWSPTEVIGTEQLNTEVSEPVSLFPQLCNSPHVKLNWYFFFSVNKISDKE